VYLEAMEEGPVETWKLRVDIPFFSNQQRVVMMMRTKGSYQDILHFKNSLSSEM
jgi:cephalosporin-C deacetylase-like acetyl esterase